MTASQRVTAGLLCLLAASAGSAEADLDRILRFEAGAGDTGSPVGWHAAPSGSVRVDEGIVHDGAAAVLLARDASSPESFSRIIYRLPVDFEGESVELTGFLRTADVSGAAALWLRTDGAGGVLDIDNMRGRAISGSTEWTEHTVRVPLVSGAQAVVFGVFLQGTGRAWADDLRLLVDGKPVAEAPKRQAILTALDTDREFDHGSRIELGTLSERQIEHVALLGRVWGFLKYHHPQIAKGEWHWDYELFRVLPGVLAVSNAEERNHVLSDWIARIGVPERCDPCAARPENTHFMPRLAWIEDAAVLGPILAGQLQQIYRYRHAGSSHIYVSLRPGVGNPSFGHEKSYARLPATDSGFRILALFRLWNIVEYWFPYRDLVDAWPDVLLEFLPRVVAARDADRYRLEMMALVARMGDGHANLWSELDLRPPRGKCFWPVDLHFIEGELVVRSIADSSNSNFAVGDVIESIDGDSVDDLVKRRSPYYGASNATARLHQIGHAFTRGKCGVSSVTIDREGHALTQQAHRTAAPRPWSFNHDRPGEAFQLLSPEVAYLKLSAVEVSKLDEQLELAGETKGLVIDIRNYPSEFVPFELGAYLVDEPTPFARFTRPDLANPGAFRWSEPVALQPRGEGERYRGKVVILVDATSISQAEYTAMALRAAPRSIVIGSTTAGADGNVSAIPLPGGMRAAMSGIGVFYPDRTPTQRVGIVPDIVARPTLRGIRQGRDEVLEAGIRYLLGENTDETVLREISERL